jgi:flagella basal body P-ring formation protein FlgA
VRDAARWVAVAMAALSALLAIASLPARASTLDLPVPKTTIYPGDTVTTELIAERAFIAHTVTRGAVFDDPKALIGKVAKKTLLPGQPVPINAIREPYAVNQGKAAVVVFELGGLSITTQALALQNGGAGDVVTLRNIDSGIVIKGTVQADGSVRVDAP